MLNTWATDYLHQNYLGCSLKVQTPYIPLGALWWGLGNFVLNKLPVSISVLLSCSLKEVSFFLEFFLYSSPVAYWALINLGSSFFSVISFCLFILFMRFSRQEYWSGLPCPSPVDHILPELSIMTHLSWVALHRMAHSFIELDKAVVHVISLISFLWLWVSFCLPSERLTVGETGSWTYGRGHAK